MVKAFSGTAEIVGVLVTEQQVADAQLLLDALQRLEEARVGGRKQSEFGQQQRGGVEIAIAEGRGECLAFVAPRAGRGFPARM